MARDDDAREIDDTTVIGAPGMGAPGDGGEGDGAESHHAWSAVSGADVAETNVNETNDGEEFSPSGVPESVVPTVESAKPAKTPVAPPGPVLVAAGLGLLTKLGWVFQDIDLTLRPASVAAIVGPAGTGRSCLLLALSGRMAPNTGTLTVAGHSFKEHSANIRALTSVARIGSLATPEAGLTVGESIVERCLIDDVDTTVGRARFTEACAALELTLDPSVLVGTLVGDRATLCAVALACVRVSALIVLDDLDRGVSAATQQTMLAALIRLATTGPTIVLSTTDRIPVMDADVVLDLTPKDGAAMWQLEPAVPLPGRELRQLEAGATPPDQAYFDEPGLDELGPDGPGPDEPAPDDRPTQVILIADTPTENPR